MAIPYELAVKEDLELGHGTVTRTAPGGGTLQGSKVGIHTLLNGFLSVRDFGAVGDGLTDDRAAIQDALDTAPSVGKAVFFPEGIYRITAAITVKSHTRLVGVGGMGGSTHGVFVDSDLYGSVIKNVGTGVAVHCKDLTTSSNKTSMQILIEDLTIIGNGATSSHGILIDNPAMVHVNRCFIANHGGVGVDINGGAYSSSWGQNTTVKGCWMTHNYTGGVRVRGGYRPTVTTFQDCSILAGGKYLVYLENAWITDLIGNEFASLSYEGLLSGVQPHGVVIDQATCVNIFGNSFESMSGRIGNPVCAIRTGYNGDTMTNTTGGALGVQIIGNNFNPGVPDYQAIRSRTTRGLVVESNFVHDGVAGIGSANAFLTLDSQETPWPLFDIRKNSFFGTVNIVPLVVLAGTYQACHIRTPVYDASIEIDINASAGFAYYHRITVTNTTAFTIVNPTGYGFSDEIEINIRNQSGGAMGVITWGALYKLAAWTNPANNTSRTIRFRMDSSGDWYEMSRTAADVPN